MEEKFRKGDGENNKDAIVLDRSISAALHEYEAAESHTILSPS